MKRKLLLITVLFLSFNTNAQHSYEELEINPNGDSKPHSFVEFNGAIYYAANDGINGIELWKTDGTKTGTVLVKDINPNGDSDPRRLTVVNNQLFFTAKTDENGRELWITDGTEQGTVLVKDINTGFGDGVSTSREQFKELNNKLVFTGQLQGASNTYLFESDGTEQGTKPIDTNVTVEVNFYTEYNMVKYNNFIVFPGTNKAGSSQGRELWKTDGTTTSLIKDINVGSSSSFPSEMTVYNDNVYFVANNGITGKELWKTDGTDAGTMLVRDIRNGGASSFSNYARFTVFNNKLYFSANDGTRGREIWVTDGTEIGTTIFLDINSTGNQNGIIEDDVAQQLFYVFNNKMYFKASSTYNASNQFNNIEPWETDGTVGGTKQIADLNPTGNSMNEYSYFYSYNNRLIFTGVDFSNPTLGTLWSYNFLTTPKIMTPNNTTFTDVETDWYKPIIFNEALYLSANFSINNTNNGTELWKITSTPLSIKNFKNNFAVHIFPNPTRLNFTILNENKTIQKLEIFNILGKKVKEKRYNNLNKVQLENLNLSQGMYLVKIFSEGTILSKKLIIR